MHTAILNDGYLLEHLPDGSGVYLDDETSEYVITYRQSEERICTSENPSVDTLIDIAMSLMADYEECE